MWPMHAIALHDPVQLFNESTYHVYGEKINEKLKCFMRRRCRVLLACVLNFLSENVCSFDFIVQGVALFDYVSCFVMMVIVLSV